MIVNDHGTDFTTKFDVDKISHPDSQLVKIRGNMFSLGDVRQEYNDFGEKNKSMTIVYDDVFQYTSIGLMDIIFELRDIPSPIPIKEFMGRKCSGNKFVKDICSVWGVSPEEVDYIERKYYAEILRRSPLSSNSKGFMMMREFLNSQLFVFRNYCDGIKENLDLLAKKYKNADKKQYVSMETYYLNGQTQKEYFESLSNEKYRYFEIVITDDAGSVMTTIDKHKIDVGSSIFTFMNHNGLSKDQYETVLLNEGYGNGDYRIDFIKEGLALC